MHVEIYGKVSASLLATLKTHLATHCTQLDVPLTFSPDDEPAAGERRITLVFAAKGSTWTEQEEQTFRAVVKAGVVVMPVVQDAPTAKFLPKAVSHTNAFIMDFFGAAWGECLADEILSQVWLRRRVPKVFISYKRTDSHAIASQLYDRLNHLGYQTFLDEASVPRVADFQRELKWWLNDADLLIVLASPRFTRSEWCMEEVSFCQQRLVGIVLVEWPDGIYGNSQIAAPTIPFPEVQGKPIIIERAMPGQRLTLQLDDFDGVPSFGDPELPKRELTADGLSRILKLCATQRTRAIQQRLNNVIATAQGLLAGAAPIASGVDSDLSYPNASGPSFVRVLPFRPRPEDIWQAATDGFAHAKVAGCFYDENDDKDPRAMALRWLANAKRETTGEQSDGWLWASVGGKLW